MSLSTEELREMGRRMDVRALRNQKIRGEITKMQDYSMTELLSILDDPYKAPEMIAEAKAEARRRFHLDEAPSEKEATMREWWEALNAAEIEKVVPKALEYGAADLKIMGAAMQCLGRMRWDGMTEVEGMELACAFYALGKVARMFGAFERGELPSIDQAHDLGVYCRMIQKIRETGEWI